MASSKGFGAELFEGIAPTIKDLFTSYVQKDKSTDNLTWLAGTLMKHVPEASSAAQATQLGQDILSTIDKFSANMSGIEKICATGKTKEDWLRKYLSAQSEGKMQEMGDYLSQINGALHAGNQAMASAMQAQDGAINITEEVNRLVQEQGAMAAGGTEWNPYMISALANQIGQQANLAGIQMGAFPFGANLGLQAGQGEQVIFPQDMSEMNRGSALDEGFKAVAAAALKIGIMNGKIPVLSKVLPIGAVTNIACLGVEGVKSISRVATGKMTAMQALEHMGRSSVAVAADLCATGVSAKLFATIPVVGPALGLATGAYLGSLTSQQIQQTIYAGITKVKPVALSVARTVTAAVNPVAMVNKVAKFVGI